MRPAPTKSEWILWVPGASNHFNCLKTLMMTGKRRKEIKNEITEKTASRGRVIIAISKLFRYPAKVHTP